MRFTLIILALSSTSVFAATKIACVGNSITYGYDLQWGQSYPSQWQTMLGNVYSVSNFGVSGTTVLKNGDNPYWKQGAFQNARDFSPEVVVIELGTNDSKAYNWYVRPSEFAADYTSLIDTFQVLPAKPRIFICLAPYSNNSQWGILDTSIVKRINPDILQVGLAKGVAILDMHSRFQNPLWLLADSVHPNATGAVEFARIINEYYQGDTLQIVHSGSELIAPTGFAFQWYLDGQVITSATSNRYTPTQTGVYKVSVKIENDTETRLVSQDFSLESLDPVYSFPTQEQRQAQIFWNQGNLLLDLPDAGSYSLSLLDAQGRILLSKRVAGLRGLQSLAIPQRSGAAMLQVIYGSSQLTQALPPSRPAP